MRLPDGAETKTSELSVPHGHAEEEYGLCVFMNAWLCGSPAQSVAEHLYGWLEMRQAAGRDTPSS